VWVVYLNLWRYYVWTRSDVDLLHIERFNPRVFDSKHPATLRRIEYLTELDYEVVGHHDPGFHSGKPIFTVLLTLFDGNPDFIRHSINSVLAQSYENTEVVLIDNGSTGEIASLIEEAFLAHRKSKLLRLPEHRFDPTLADFLDPIPNLWNAGLFASVGEFVYFLSYDDALSTNYVECMVRLFQENANCNSASPMVCSMDENAEINIDVSERLAAMNVRGRYTNGVVLAESKMRGHDLMGAPGGLLAQRSSAVILGGGFDALNDFGQVFRFAIHGDSGFDPEAMLYWRLHDMQANKVAKGMGLVYYSEYSGYSERYGIRSLHMGVDGAAFADEFDAYWGALTADMAIWSVRDSFRGYGFVSGTAALRRLFVESPIDVWLRGLAWALRDLPFSLLRTRFPRGIRWYLNIKHALLGPRRR
jgi:glycosyltransferase involved in cell wall biosynthesis